jgi:hypothetical protein
MTDPIAGGARGAVEHDRLAFAQRQIVLWIAFKVVQCYQCTVVCCWCDEG